MAWLCAGGAVACLMGFTPGRPGGVPPISAAAKFSLSYLSQSQAEALRKRVDDHALAEALLHQCGAPSHIEHRMISVARDCIEARTIDDALSKALLDVMRSKIDRDVNEVRARCKACLVC
jgi:hypothetical protein